MTYTSVVTSTGGTQFVTRLYDGNFEFRKLGLQLAVGTGDVAWDTTPTAPLEYDTGLVCETARVKPYWMGWLVEAEYDRNKILWSPTQTKICRFVAKFPRTLFANDTRIQGYDLREIGLFMEARPDLNSGLLVIETHHTRWWWDRSFSLRREILLDMRG
jgi:hypothetical protein